MTTTINGVLGLHGLTSTCGLAKLSKNATSAGFHCPLRSASRRDDLSVSDEGRGKLGGSEADVLLQFAVSVILCPIVCTAYLYCVSITTLHLKYRVCTASG